MQIMSQQEIYLSENVWWPHDIKKAQKKWSTERYSRSLGLPGLWSGAELTVRVGEFCMICNSADNQNVNLEKNMLNRWFNWGIELLLYF